jgi:acyl-CoA thioesterase FadM
LHRLATSAKEGAPGVPGDAIHRPRGPAPPVYPLFRFRAELRRAARMPRLGLDEAHVSRHTCLPWDIDPWRELNNGRTLTLYDIGRIALLVRTGLDAVLKREGWGAAVAGASVRYRRRVRAWERFTMRSLCVGRCERFFYFHQTMWKGEEAASSLLIREAVTADGIVPTDRVMAACGQPDWHPALPAWVAAWHEADGRRPWPPTP